ncbi:D-glycero-alpha-D-manno-heptose-1,7-bisphosphate 7-phosphatase [Floridanema evergladense]|uniref:D,D-heptose 1,7-bisphosphate phosphatase n=1 Tax=Floridaenema evergladense BLCC-F167 TaxID=3153639 RepID=A0ABV4WIK5_9CYAN
MNRAVFLDKDGTLIPNVSYNVNPDLIELSAGAVEGLRSLQAAGYKIIVISNQSGVALGYFSEDKLLPMQLKLTQLLAEIGIKLTGFYYCPHHPEGKISEYKISCSCRKPEPGLILRAAKEHYINLENSWFIGDILNDVEAGHRAGCKSILINNGNETEWVFTSRRMPDYVATDINDAAKKIISKSVVFPKSKMTSYAFH